jgi:hypothetical protein
MFASTGFGGQSPKSQSSTDVATVSRSGWTLGDSSRSPMASGGVYDSNPSGAGTVAVIIASNNTPILLGAETTTPTASNVLTNYDFGVGIVTNTTVIGNDKDLFDLAFGGDPAEPPSKPVKATLASVGAKYCQYLMWFLAAVAIVAVALGIVYNQEHGLGSNNPPNLGNGTVYVPTYMPTLPTIVTASPTALSSLAPTNIGQPTVLSPTAGPSEEPSPSPTEYPTPGPTFVPSTAPTYLPGVPTPEPSTASPTSLPTYVPTIAITTAPSGVPTLPPSATPTAAPTMAPTFLPGAPTPVPTTATPSTPPAASPSAGPTVVPSKRPTVPPTKRPTAEPTASPTVDAAVTGQTVYDAAISNSEYSTASTTYAELQTKGGYSQGGLSGWSSFQYKMLSSWIGGGVADSITLQSANGVGSVYSSSSVSCSGNSAAVNSITDNFVMISSSAATVSCGGNNWTVQLCDDSYPALSINSASDPCDTVCAGNSYVINPYLSASCTGANTFRVNALSVSFSTEDTTSASTSISYPTILNATASSSSRLLVRATLPSTSSSSMSSLLSAKTVYCGAFASSASAPATVLGITKQSSVIQSKYTSNGVDHFNVVITGLTPVTDYDVYCVGVSSSALSTVSSKSLNSAMLANHSTTATTSCCKSIELAVSESVIDVASESTSGYAVSTGALTVALDYFPASGLNVSFAFQSSEDDISVYTYPSYVYFDSSSSAGSLSFSVDVVVDTSMSTTALTAADVVVELVLNGISAAEYSVITATSAANASFSIINSSSASLSLPAPQVVSAAFGSSGNVLTIHFDRPTDGGSAAGLDSATSTTFSCSTLLSFSSSDELECSWSSSRQSLLAYVEYDSALGVGDSVALLAGVLKADCSTPDNCDFSGAGSSILITAPSSPVIPVAVLTVPTTVSVCSELNVDISASTGSGGRQWASSSSVQVSCSNCGSSVLATVNTDYLASLALDGGSVQLPAGSLPQGNVYTFSATVCNHFGECSSASASTTVLGTSLVVPTISLAGSQSRTITQGQSLAVAVNAYTPSCASGSSSLQGARNNITLSWSMVETSSSRRRLTSSSSFSSVSSNPFQFVLLANTLTTLSTYQLMVTVQDASTSFTQSVYMSVYVAASTLVAIIAGGSKQAVRVGQSIVLDASQSNYDDQWDYSAATVSASSSASGLTYSWTCRQSLPLPASNCPLTFLSSIAASLVELDASMVSTAVVTALVSDSSTSAAGFVYVTTVATTLPSMQVTFDGLALNPAQRNKLLGIVSSSSGHDLPTGTATWSCVTDSGLNVDLESMSLTSITQSITSSTSSDAVSYSFYLALPPDSLPSSAHYLTFSLSYAGSSGISSSSMASISIAVNTGPQPGILHVTPETGYALTTAFFLQARNWHSEELPLEYAFELSGAACDNSQSHVLKYYSEQSFVNTFLPTGCQFDSYNVSVALVVRDSLSSTTSATTSVQVLSNSASLTEMQAQLEALFSLSSQSPDTISQIMALGTAALTSVNSVDCSEATASYCAGLNRASCGTVSNTCGLCLSGYFGESYPSNNECFDESSRRRMSLSATASKECPNDCSSSGTCSFMSLDTGLSVSICSIVDDSCITVCVCDSSSYGYSCSYSLTEYSTAKAMQATLLRVLKAEIEQATVTYNTSQVTADQVVAWANGLSAAIITGSDIRSYADTPLNVYSSLVAPSLRTILTEANAQGVDYTLLTSLWSVLDAMTLSGHFAGRDHSVSNENSLDAYLASMTENIWTSLITGQSSVEVAQTSFTLNCGISSLTSASSSIHIKSAVSSLASMGSSAVPVSASMNVVGVSGVDTDALKTAIAYARPSLLSESNNTLSLIAEAATVLVDDSSLVSGTIQLTLTSFDSTALTAYDNITEVLASHDSDSTVSTTCKHGKAQNVSVTGCDLGPVILYCDGTWAGRLTARCPFEIPIARCLLYGDATESTLSSYELEPVSTSSSLLNCSYTLQTMSALGLTVDSGTADESSSSAVVQMSAVWGSFEYAPVPTRSASTSSPSTTSLGMVIGLSVGLGCGFIVLATLFSTWAWKRYYSSDKGSSVDIQSSRAASSRTARTRTTGRATSTSNPAYQRLDRNSRRGATRGSDGGDAADENDDNNIDDDLESGRVRIRVPNNAVPTQPVLKQRATFMSFMSAGSPTDVSTPALSPNTDGTASPSPSPPQQATRLLPSWLSLRSVNWEQAEAVEQAAVSEASKRSNTQPDARAQQQAKTKSKAGARQEVSNTDEAAASKSPTAKGARRGLFGSGPKSPAKDAAATVTTTNPAKSPSKSPGKSSASSPTKSTANKSPAKENAEVGTPKKTGAIGNVRADSPTPLDAESVSVRLPRRSSFSSPGPTITHANIALNVKPQAQSGKSSSSLAASAAQEADESKEAESVSANVSKDKDLASSMQSRLSRSLFSKYRPGRENGKSPDDRPDSATSSPTFSRPFTPTTLASPGKTADDNSRPQSVRSPQREKQDGYMDELHTKLKIAAPQPTIKSVEAVETGLRRGSLKETASALEHKLMKRGSTSVSPSPLAVPSTSPSTAPGSLQRDSRAKSASPNTKSTVINLPAPPRSSSASSASASASSSTIVIEIGQSTRRGSNAVYSRLPPLVPVPIVDALGSVDVDESPRSGRHAGPTANASNINRNNASTTDADRENVPTGAGGSLRTRMSSILQFPKTHN